MDRRNFLGASAAGLAAGAASAAESASNQYFELREYKLRYSHARQPQRLREFFEKEHLPMTKRVGAAAAGYFDVYLGEESPRVFSLVVHDSLARMQETIEAQRADKAWVKAAAEFDAEPRPAFDRVESRLLRAFDGMPKIEIPEIKADKPPRFFDLRTYQAETFSDVAEKINMFNTEEIAIFRKTGVNPVFFGETIVGSKMPNLTYLVWYDDVAARSKAWEAFLAHPDWIRIRSKPGWGNEDIVSDVGNTHLRPLPFSPIR